MPTADARRRSPRRRCWLALGAGAGASGAAQPPRRRRRPRGSSRWSRRSPRCSSPSAPVRRSWRSAASTPIRPRSRGCPRVGALLDPDVERVLSLTPDLVAIYGSQTDLRRQLERASIPVFDYRHGGLADIFATMRALGAAHRARHHAPTRWPRGIERRIDGDPPAHRRRGPGRACCWCSAASRARCATSTPAADAASCTTCWSPPAAINVFADVARESVQATTELVLRAGARRDPRGARTTPAWTDADTAEAPRPGRRLAAVPAVKDRRVHVLAGEGLVVPGPRVADAVERLAARAASGRRAR